MTGEQARSARLLEGMLLSGASLIVAALLLAGVEGGLRLTGIGRADASANARLRYQQVFLPILAPDHRDDGTPVLRTVDPRLPPQSVLFDKPPNGLRVFVLGGSATAGLGFSPNATFTRYLGDLLRLAYPDRLVETVNLGITGLSARQVRLLVSDATEHGDPDLVIVYSGNNEFLEIHAEKYAAAHANLGSRLMDLLSRTNLYRFLARATRGPPTAPSLADLDVSLDDLRLAQDAIIRDIELTDDEVTRIVEEYVSSLEGMARTAAATKTPILLLSVASNWEWRGRSDLPDGWLAALAGDTPEHGRYDRAITLITDTLRVASRKDRYEWLFKRAVAHRALGDFDRARDDYRAAMNVDPHLRRALDRMNEGVRGVAARTDATFVDIVERLARRSEHGIIGFDLLYDYVHFTPKGALLAAAEIFEAIHHMEEFPVTGRFDATRHVAERLTMLDGLVEDPLPVDEWLGLGFDPNAISNRDLWKYDKMIADLDDLLEREPGNIRALIYRGNANFFKVGAATASARDYEAALAIDPTLGAAKRNLDLLSAR